MAVETVGIVLVFLVSAASTRYDPSYGTRNAWFSPSLVNMDLGALGY
jgi:hypothetical protein